MKLFILIILSIFFYQTSQAQEAEFGQYQYPQYLGIQQQLLNQRNNAIRRQRIYNQSPTRNIRYPNAYNRYPNIQRTQNTSITPRQRYSAQYYRNL